MIRLPQFWIVSRLLRRRSKYFMVFIEETAICNLYLSESFSLQGERVIRERKSLRKRAKSKTIIIVIIVRIRDFVCWTDIVIDKNIWKDVTYFKAKLYSVIV